MVRTLIWLLLLSLVGLRLRFWLKRWGFLPAIELGHRRYGGAATDHFDPYATLGIASDASLQEIKRAYHKQLKLYHPDRVAGLGVELVKKAEEKTQQINNAYRILTGER